MKTPISNSPLDYTNIPLPQRAAIEKAQKALDFQREELERQRQELEADQIRLEKERQDFMARQYLAPPEQLLTREEQVDNAIEDIIDSLTYSFGEEISAYDERITKALKIIAGF